MGVELTNWANYLKGISGKGWRIDADTPTPPTDEEVTQLVSEFRDAVLYLYNNTFRACGLAVGDRQSECNSMNIYDLLCRRMDERIGEELVEARREELKTLEAREAELMTQKDRLEGELKDLSKRIWKLKELTQ